MNELIDKFELVHVIVLCLVMVCDYILGVTNRYYSNSIIEVVLRSIGFVIFHVVKPKRATLTKKKGLRNEQSKTDVQV